MDGSSFSALIQSLVLDWTDGWTFVFGTDTVISALMDSFFFSGTPAVNFVSALKKYLKDKWINKMTTQNNVQTYKFSTWMPSFWQQTNSLWYKVIERNEYRQDEKIFDKVDKVETGLDWYEVFSQSQDTTDALPCHIHLPVCLWINDPHSRAPKKNASHGNEVLPQDTKHLLQRPCYQRGSPCQDPAGNRITRIPPDHRKETQTALVWSCLPFIRSGRNHLARHSERGRRQGRQRKRWEDNIREWTGLEFEKSQRAGIRDREWWW